MDKKIAIEVERILLQLGIKEQFKLQKVEEGHSQEKWRIQIGLSNYLIRFPKSRIDRFRNSVLAQELFYQSNGQTSKIISSNISDNSEQMYCLQDYINGNDCETIWKHFSKSEKENLSRKSGRTLFDLHKITDVHFSDSIESSERFDKWSDYCLKRLTTLIDLNYTIGVLPVDKILKMKNAINLIIKNVEFDFKPSFVHKDFHLGNLIFEKEKDELFIIDFETSCFLDPAWDFVKLEIWFFSQQDYLKDAFYSGYNLSAQDNHNFKRRIFLCKGLEFLSSINFWSNIMPDKEMLIKFDRYLNLWLNEFEAGEFNR